LTEPVIATSSLLDALARPHRKWIFSYNIVDLRLSAKRVQIADALLQPRFIVFTAGEGNAELMRRAEVGGESMQRRPLTMALLRGATLPLLFAHCIVRGKTQLTITTPRPKLWQVGGEIAEQLAHQENMDQGRRAVLREVKRCLPGMDFSDVEIAIYSATRAEAKTAEQKRPSGVHVSRVAPNIVVGWPTKLSMAPILAEEVFSTVHAELKQPAGYEEPAIPWPTPDVARSPWEDAEWYTVC
jgi:hypothetical protein